MILKKKNDKIKNLYCRYKIQGRFLHFLDLIIILLLFSVDLTSYFVGKDPSMLSIYKGIDYSLAFICITLSFIKKNSLVSKHYDIRMWRFVYFYIFIFFIRIFCDFFINDEKIQMISNKYTILFLFFNVYILQSVYFYKRRIAISPLLLSMTLGLTLFICLSISFFVNISSNVLTYDSRYSGNDYFDLLLYGHTGATLVIIGITLLISYKNRFVNLCSILFVAIGLFTLIMSGTRSAFVALFFVFIFVVISKKKNRSINLFFFALFISIFVFNINDINNFLISNDIYSLDRVLNADISGDISNGRNNLVSIGINYFLDNPLLGKSYLLPDGSYIHNLFVEGFMALGIVGGVTFVYINIKALCMAYRITIMNSKYILVPLLYIQYMTFGCFSRTSLLLPQYWLFLFFILNLYDSINSNGKCEKNGVSNCSHI